MAGTVLLDVLHARLKGCVQGEDRLGFLVERARLGRREQTVVDTLEQREADLAFEMLDRVANRRLRQPQFLRGTNRRLAADDGAQKLDLAKIHDSVPNRAGQLYSVSKS